jgi:hypothetical protein
MKSMRFADLFIKLKSDTGANDSLPTGQNNAQDDSAETLSGDKGASRRKFSRRECDDCVSEINGKKFPVQDWSLGGLQVTGGSNQFGLNDDVEITMKFRLSDGVVAIPHKAKVVRRTHNNIGLEFEPLTRGIHDELQVVVDDYTARQKAN